MKVKAKRLVSTLPGFYGNLCFLAMGTEVTAASIANKFSWGRFYAVTAGLRPERLAFGRFEMYLFLRRVGIHSSHPAHETRYASLDAQRNTKGTGFHCSRIVPESLASCFQHLNSTLDSGAKTVQASYSNVRAVPFATMALVPFSSIE